MNIKSKVKTNIDMLLVIALGVMQTLDFLITWAGIKIYGVIQEGNPFMVWMFDLNFLQGLIIRLLFIFGIAVLLTYLRREKRAYFIGVVSIGLLANITILYMHFLWILPYL